MVWGKVGASVVCSASSHGNGDATPNFKRPIPVITSGLVQPMSGRGEGNDLASSCLWRDSFWASLQGQLIDRCIVSSRDLSARQLSCH